MQKRLKNLNQDKIINGLSKEPKRFTDLLESTGLSSAGLTKILSSLIKEGKIVKTIHNGKEAYALTKKGLAHGKSIWILISELLELGEKGASYEQQEDIFGFSLHSVFDIEGPELQYFPKFGKVRGQIFQLMHEYFNSDRIPTNKPLCGKIILAAEVDLEKLSSVVRKNKEKLVMKQDEK